MVDEAPGTPEAQPTDPAARRERIIQNLLHKPTAWGRGVGIWAARPCQICSRVATFSGFAMAMGVHVGPYSDFVCSTCRSGPVPNGHRRTFDEGRRSAAGILATQSYRICERCHARLEPFAPHRLRSFWVCPPCALAVDGDADALSVLARRRYLDLEYPTDEALRAFDLAMERTALDLEETLAPDDRARLEAERPARARAMLERLRRVHGADYRVPGPAPEETAPPPDTSPAP